MEKISKRVFFYIILAVFLSGIWLVFSTSTSPLFPNTYGYDSAYYRYIGSSILEGKVPYRDIWDHKGPVLYFIQALGALHGTRNGKISLIFPMQILSMLLSIFFLEQIDRKATRSRFRLTRLFFLVISALSVFCSYTLEEGGNLTEEWSFPMVCCSLYLFMKYGSFAEAEPRHPRRYAFIHGICFALVAFIRLNNAVSICAGLLIIGIYLIIKRQWKNILENILTGLLGIAVVAVPVFAYFYVNNALEDMIYAVFLFNLNYAKLISGPSFFEIRPLAQFLPIFASFVLFILHFIKYRKFRLTDAIALAIAAANAILLYRIHMFWHYFQIYIPVFLLFLILYAGIPDRLALLTAAAVSVFFIRDAVQIGIMNLQNKQTPLFDEAVRNIPKSERDSVIAINITPEIYLNTGIIPCSRFAAIQLNILPIKPDYEKEFISDLQEKNPKWVIMRCNNDGLIPYLDEPIELRYENRFNASAYCFYRQKDAE